MGVIFLHRSRDWKDFLYVCMFVYVCINVRGYNFNPLDTKFGTQFGSIRRWGPLMGTTISVIFNPNVSLMSSISRPKSLSLGVAPYD